MNTNSLSYAFDLLAKIGRNLSEEEKNALRTSLVILKKNFIFNRVIFWGKILGLRNDYFIALGRGKDEMQNQKYLYSLNCLDWYLLPPFTDSMIKKVSKVARGCFMGDPSYVYEHVEIRRKGRKAVAEEVWIQVTEENRLVVTVCQIDQEVSVVPRGAFIKSPHGLVQVNQNFRGLSYSEAGKLENYLHFTKQKNLKKRSILEMGGMNHVIDFMDLLSDDIPKGSWRLQFECTKCVIQSHLWPGLTFYHIPKTPEHGYIYIGDGTKNMNLPFMP